jgi:hypothetical protein
MTEPIPESSDNPGGIDYERWTQLVNPAPREAFADALDPIPESGGYPQTRPEPHRSRSPATVATT